MGWLDNANKTNIISIERINPDELFNYFNKTDKFMEKKRFETNKSLSARVRRRNSAGFTGEGNHVMVKKDNVGDYRDVSQNHKDTDTKQHKELIKLCYSIGIKRAGSKTMKVLRSHIYKPVKKLTIKGIENALSHVLSNV